MLRKSLSAIICIVMLFSIAAVAPITADAAAPKLNKSKVTLRVDKTCKLKLKNATASYVYWSSSNYSVASVYNGKVTARSKGTAKITATYNNKKYVCKVTVKPKITYFGKVFKVYKNDTYKLVLKNSWGLTYNAKKWTSSKKKIATIDKNGRVKAKKVGATTITAVDSNNNLVRGTVKVVDGFKALKNYINKKGKKNNSGDKYITTKDSSYTYTILYSASKKNFVFSGKYKSGSNEASVSATIHYGNLKTAKVSGEVYYPYSDLDAMGEIKKLNTAKYNNNKDYNFKVTYGYAEDYTELNYKCNALLHMSFVKWKNMLYDKLTMGMAAVGFNKYPLI